jgi:hypothetical protein
MRIVAPKFFLVQLYHLYRISLSQTLFCAFDRRATRVFLAMGSKRRVPSQMMKSSCQADPTPLNQIQGHQKYLY